MGHHGFYCSLVDRSLTHNETSTKPVLYCLGSGPDIRHLRLYASKMPASFTQVQAINHLKEYLGLNAFALFKTPKFAIFFAFSLLLGAALQLTNAYGDTFIHDFKNIA